MGNFICENIFVPLRSGPSHKTEMLSQILFGEKYSIIDKAGSWIKIETLFDKDRDGLMRTIFNILLLTAFLRTRIEQIVTML